MEWMVIIFSLLTYIDVGYKTIERIYSDEAVRLAIFNVDWSKSPQLAAIGIAEAESVYLIVPFHEKAYKLLLFYSNIKKL